MDIGGGVSRAFCTHEKGQQSGHHLVPTHRPEVHGDDLDVHTVRRFETVNGFRLHQRRQRRDVLEKALDA